MGVLSSVISSEHVIFIKGNVVHFNEYCEKLSSLYATIVIAVLEEILSSVMDSAPIAR